MNVVCGLDGLLLVGNSQDFAFVRVEGHLPLILQVLNIQSNQALLSDDSRTTDLRLGLSFKSGWQAL